MQIASAHTVVTSVAVTSGSTPNDGGLNSGDHSVPVRKSPIETERKNSIVGAARATTIPAVVAMDTAAQRNKRTAMTRSPQRGRVRARLNGLTADAAVPASMGARP